MGSIFREKNLDWISKRYGHEIEHLRLRYPVYPIPNWTVHCPSLLKSEGFEIEIEHFGLGYPDLTSADTYERLESYLQKIAEFTSQLKFHYSQSLYSDPRKFHFAEKFGYVQPLYLGSESDPGKFHFADGSGYVQLLRSLLFDPNYKGAADRIRSDSAYKEAIQNAGMSGAGGSKGKGGEPTKDDEVANRGTMAWKLGLSVEAVTPNFIASAKISLEMKSGSGSGSNSKSPPLPPMPTPLVGKLYDCFLGIKKKFID